MDENLKALKEQAKDPSLAAKQAYINALEAEVDRLTKVLNVATWDSTMKPITYTR